jgi:hypothetical protein
MIKNCLTSFSFFLIAVSFCLFGYSYYIKTDKYIKNAYVLNQEHDYQIIQLGQMRADQFLIDKKTGCVWTAVCRGEVKGSQCHGEIIWQKMWVEK